jgi:predicted metal-dependent RNase
MQSSLNFKVLKKSIIELPSDLQKEVIDFVDFLKYKSKTVEEDNLLEEEKAELRKRIAFSKKNPDKLLTKKAAIKKLEKSLGRKIQIKS